MVIRKQEDTKNNTPAPVNECATQQCADVETQIAPTSDDTVSSSEKVGILGYLTEKKEKTRIWEIDFLRGFCVLLMILDHTACMLAGYFGPAWYGGFYQMKISQEFGAKLCSLCFEYWYSGLRDIGHPIVLFIFFSISGLSCAFSRSNLKRGVVLAFVSALFSLVTYVLDLTLRLDCFVSFGVLHFYTVCILTWAIICKICDNNTIAKTIFSGVFVILVAVLYHCYIAPETTPKWLFFVFPSSNVDGSNALFYSQNEVSPGDLFTIIPWAAFFFAGTFLQPFLYPKRCSLLPKLNGKWNKPICFLGRHALLIYVTHVVAVAIILVIVSLIFFGTRGLF